MNSRFRDGRRPRRARHRPDARRISRRRADGVGLLFTFQDVTKIKKLERDAAIQQRLAAVGEMAAGIAHEIRNPLASMSGSIQILRQELPLSAEQEQLMDIVLRESERLNTTIRSFLAYARPQRFQIARFDVRRALNDAALAAAQQLRTSSKGTRSIVDLPPQRTVVRSRRRADQANRLEPRAPTACAPMPERRRAAPERQRRCRSAAS